MKAQIKTHKQQIAELKESNRKLARVLEVVIKLAEDWRPTPSEMDKIFFACNSEHPADYVLRVAKETLQSEAVK